MGNVLKEKKVGFIGFGQVAQRMSELLKAFNCELAGCDLHWNAAAGEKHGAVEMSLNELVAWADIISLHIPGGPANRHVVGAAQFDAMKENVILVNTSRGGLIDEDALLNFLSKNPSAKAYLDTFEEEPYKGVFCNHDQVLVTPHMGSYAHEVRMKMEDETASKLIRYFKNNG